ncbi:MAG: ABC transporter permease [Bacteroidetes bacterium]|nr:ABC transporter permease [Bacteroidota bacterium]
MSTSLNIMRNSLRLTFQELRVNKLRTALSLFGVAFGIVCIIGVLALVNSLETNIQNEVKSLGTNTIYIDKWDYSGGPDRPIWKYRARPNMKQEEADMIKKRSYLLDKISFLLRTGGAISYGDEVIQNSSVYGITEAQIDVQPFTFDYGRFFSNSEFTAGSNVCVIGYANAESLFGTAERAVGKQIEVRGRKTNIVGVIKKEGKNFIGWDYDNCIMLPYKYCTQLFKEEYSNPVLIAKGKAGVTPTDLSNELKGIMRQVRRLAPLQEENFSLNSVEAFSKAISQSFVTIDIIGAFIGIICLIIGLFGIANIMFVTVKERTPIIGLKKAVGAKRTSILFEFLMEAVLLCIIGGAVGLLIVSVTLAIFSKLANFPLFISLPLLIVSIIICVTVGILAGIIPARRAAKMDAVAAIRSK